MQIKKRNLIIYLFLSMISCRATADIYEEMSALRRQDFIDKLCEFASDEYSEFAKFTGDIFQNILEISAPGSKDREMLIEMLRKKQDALEDENYLERKRLAERWSPDNSARRELIYAVLSNARAKAKLVAYKEPGKSQTTYRRLIEQGCKYPQLK